MALGCSLGGVESSLGLGLRNRGRLGRWAGMQCRGLFAGQREQCPGREEGCGLCDGVEQLGLHGCSHGGHGDALRRICFGDVF